MLHHVVAGVFWIVLAERLFRRAHDLFGEVHSGLVAKLDRAEREAELFSRVLDQRRFDTFGDHPVGFAAIGDDAAVGVEEPGVVDDDRGLLDLTHEIERLGDRLRPGVLALDDLDQHHLVDGREEMDADEPRLIARRLRQI